MLTGFSGWIESACNAKVFMQRGWQYITDYIGSMHIFQHQLASSKLLFALKTWINTIYTFITKTICGQTFSLNLYVVRQTLVLHGFGKSKIKQMLYSVYPALLSVSFELDCCPISRIYIVLLGAKLQFSYFITKPHYFFFLYSKACAHW